jgi:hypothetical protein
MNTHEPIRLKGDVEGIVEWDDGRIKRLAFPNTVLTLGKMALANSLANVVDDTYDFYISSMIFGDSGVSGGVEKFVNAARTGLFGVTRVRKPVISSIDADNQTQVIFTSVLTREDGNGYGLNEMALEMANGQLYSMVTFPDLNKTNQMQITWNWRLSFV